MLDALVGYRAKGRIGFTPPGHKQARGTDPAVREVLGDVVFHGDVPTERSRGAPLHAFALRPYRVLRVAGGGDPRREHPEPCARRTREQGQARDDCGAAAAAQDDGARGTGERERLCRTQQGAGPAPAVGLGDRTETTLRRLHDHGVRERGESGEGMATATYGWKYEGEMLTFSKVDDKCPGRSSGLTAGPWKRKK